MEVIKLAGMRVQARKAGVCHAVQRFCGCRTFNLFVCLLKGEKQQCATNIKQVATTTLNMGQPSVDSFS